MTHELHRNRQALAAIDCRNCIAVDSAGRQFLPHARQSPITDDKRTQRSRGTYVLLLRPFEAAAQHFLLADDAAQPHRECRDPPPRIRFSCGPMTDSPGLPPDRVPGEVPLLHEFKNHLSVIVGFCDLLLTELREDDPKRADIQEVLKAGHAAIALLPELADRLR
jgi:hypothetical protein